MFIRLSMQSLIDTIGNNPEKYFQIWKQIKTEEELFMCNIEFIKGRIYGTPSHDGPLNFDSVLNVSSTFSSIYFSNEIAESTTSNVIYD